MNRKININKLKEVPLWDIIVIGGGATGLGTAVDAATRGYKTLLLEQADFAKGTSSRSTKLVHGGVRYLAQGDISLVLEALKERGLLRQNAPHLVSNQAFIIPTYEWWDGPFYTIGLKVYDMMSGKLGLGPSERLDSKTVMEAIPNLKKEGLNGGVMYYDGQFDDARLAISLAQTLEDNRGTAINYCQVTGILKDSMGFVSGVQAVDQETNETYKIKAKVVINATGVFADNVIRLDHPESKKTIVPSQGVHLIIDRKFLQGETAIMIPKTPDGRVLFAVPWHNKVVVGTTDTLMENISLEPRALPEEIDFILNTAGDYLVYRPKRSDVRSVFAGLRPLAAPEEGDEKTKEISRSHKITISPSGLLTITGGKWTTYRKMGEDVIEKAILIGGLEEKPCVTSSLPIHGYVRAFDENDPLHYYGSNRNKILSLARKEENLTQPLVEGFPYTRAEVVWAVREEMARTVEDFLARRSRFLLLDARKSIEAAPVVAKIMAEEMNLRRRWVREQIESYTRLAQGYVLD
ncbi:glycerol-3-phosphate dehydrogenase/oxidase [Candidatus Sulfidibacterium hydrothermale]|uniref:glycerol-3-phosphate dehydrogenase/oxidase n=1 Tax=Candidatus Sulfidibacterium hydrothermale TaxID=2875962 RepID=UPI001F0AB75A|nr:glycerol-3-phosphate dehydrogenase/oxidase [Candidatus Sulfidibacterium hydrothermale]UBM62969.1 glycerol-3-phosphate dehydrogenase/oxidase [Candidatus Sulfidibacterium hydrothermale]